LKQKQKCTQATSVAEKRAINERNTEDYIDYYTLFYGREYKNYTKKSIVMLY
jgi:hypothetical protein